MIKNCFLAVAAGVLSLSQLLGQSNFGAISGTITDLTGRPMAGVSVTVRSSSTGAARTVKPNDVGLYEVLNFNPGDYTIEADSSGFSHLSKSVRLEVGQQMRLDLQLTAAEKHESVDVSSKTELLKTSDASLGEVVETKSIQEFPLNGRKLLDLALSVPGSHI